jgi:DNA-binding NarL/FixJ family response regulator
LKALINAEAGMEVVGEAEDGQTALRRASVLQPDIVIMDVSMPHLNGARVTEQLKRTCPNARVLALTVHEDTGYMRQFLEAGALGYVLKRSAAEELIRAIWIVAEGGVYLDPNLAGKVVSSFIRKPSLMHVLQGSNLSDREMEVVRLIAQGYSNREIAARLEISIKTVETYKARSMEKLDLRSRVEIVRYASQQGWLDVT